jgi:hypothetical protein
MATVGVPDRIPVDESRLKPLGNEGLTEKLVAVSPV